MTRPVGNIRVFVVSKKTGNRLPGTTLSLLIAPNFQMPQHQTNEIKQKITQKVLEFSQDAKGSEKKKKTDLSSSDSDSVVSEVLEGNDHIVSTSKPIPSLHLASTVTDQVGYAKFDLTEFEPTVRDLIEKTIGEGLRSGEVDVYMEVAGDRRSRVGILQSSRLLGFKAHGAAETVALSQVGPNTDNADEILWIALFGSCKAWRIETSVSHDSNKQTVGTILFPDACDYSLSPDSFVTRRAIPVGGDGCEHLMPASLPLQQFRFNRAIVREPEQNDASLPGKANRDLSNLKEKNRSLPTKVLATGKSEFGANGQAKIDALRSDNTIRWGEILEFEQTWSSVGHSLGEIKYSLPLAPGEAVRLAMIDWNRSDSVSRSDSTESDDSLKHRQTFDRDITEIVKGKLGERQSGDSELGGIAAGIDGMYKSGQSGVSGAVRGGYAAGAAHTRGNRDMSADTTQKIHANTVQDSSLARQQYSTVIVQANQSETNTLSTRIVANMNRAHTLTVQYYEVLRHFIVRTKFKSRNTAIFIPYAPFSFTPELSQRFREQLEPALLDQRRATGFDALERLAIGGDIYLPALDPIIAISPDTLPNANTGTDYNQSFTANGGTAPYQFTKTGGSFPTGLQLSATGRLNGKPTSAETSSFEITVQDNLGFKGSKAFTMITRSAAEVAGLTATKFKLEIRSGPGHLGTDGLSDTHGSVDINVYLKGAQTTISLFAKSEGVANRFNNKTFDTANEAGYSVTRIEKDVTEINLLQIEKIGVFWKVSQSAFDLDYDGWDLSALKITCELLVKNEAVGEHILIDWQNIPKIGKITFPKPVDITPDIGDPPLSDRENTKTVNDKLKKPVTLSRGGNWTHEDAYNVKVAYRSQGLELVTTGVRLPVAPAATAGGGENDDKKNGSTVDPNRKTDNTVSVPSLRSDSVLANLLVHHLNANQSYYNSVVWLGMDPGERRMRLAEVAGEYLGGMGNTPLAISGNLIGFLYTGSTPASIAEITPGNESTFEESVITLPTRGVFAEAHLGHCNAAEQRDITRYWAFDELPISLLPNIESLKPGTYGQLQNVTPQPLQPNTLNIVNAPTVPDPSGLSDAIKLLGTANLFRDMSGLDQVNNILTKLIEAAKPPSLTAGNSGASGAGGGQTGGTKTGSSSTSGGSSGNSTNSGSGSSGGSKTTTGTSTAPSASQPGGISPVDPRSLKPTDRFDHVVVDQAQGQPNVAGYPNVTLASYPVPKKLGPSTSSIQSVVGALMDFVEETTSRLESNPDGSIGNNMRDAVVAIAEKEALNIVDEFPYLSIVKTTVRYSLVFAEAAGKHIEEVKPKIDLIYEPLLRSEITSDATQIDAKAWSLALRETRNTFTDGFTAVLDRVIDDLTDAFADTIKSIASSVTKSIAKGLLDYLQIDAILKAVGEDIGQGIPESRKAIYNVASKRLLRLSLLQYADNANLVRLSNLAKSKGFTDYPLLGLLQKLVDIGLGLIASDDAMPETEGLSNILKNYALVAAKSVREIILREGNLTLVYKSGIVEVSVDEATKTLTLPDNIALAEYAGLEQLSLNDDVTAFQDLYAMFSADCERISEAFSHAQDRKLENASGNQAAIWAADANREIYNMSSVMNNRLEGLSDAMIAVFSDTDASNLAARQLAFAPIQWRAVSVGNDGGAYA